MNESLKTEEAWLDQMRSSKLIGVCIIDENGRVVQQYSDDPALRSLILDYQQAKVSDLRAGEAILQRSEPKPYQLLS